MASEKKDLNLAVMLNALSKIARLVETTQRLVVIATFTKPYWLYVCSSNSDTKWLEWFEQKFSSLGGNNQEIDFDEFKEALHIKEV